jgi:hypothetical protein
MDRPNPIQLAVALPSRRQVSPFRGDSVRRSLVLAAQPSDRKTKAEVAGVPEKLDHRRQCSLACSVFSCLSKINSPCSPRAELVDGTTKAGVLLWIEWIPRQDELVSGAASLALKRRPEKDGADD